MLGRRHFGVTDAQPGREARVTEGLTGRVRLLVLGPLDVRDPVGREVRSVITQSKRLALLSYLALAGRDRFRRRDTVVGLFWPEADQRAARASLRQALSWLRHELGSAVLTHRGEEEIGVAADHLWCDAAAFDEAIASQDPEQALTLYRGDLLEGVFVAGAALELERWLDDERVRRRQQATRAASALAERDATDGRLDAAVEWARRAARLSPNDEANHRWLIQLLAAAGDRAGALEAYAAFRERLVEDYGTEPSAETIRLVSEMRTSKASERRSPVATRDVGSITRLTAPSAPTTAVSKPGRPLVAFLTIVLLAASATGAGVVRLWLNRSPVAPRAAPSLVLMPLTNATGDSTVDMLAEGITRGVARTLSRTAGLNAGPGSAIRGRRGGEADAREAARVAGARASLTWRVVRNADSLDIETNLVPVASGAPTVTHVYAFRPTALLFTEQAIVADLAASLAPATPSRPPGSVARSSTSNPDAYLLLLKAEHYLAKRNNEAFVRAQGLVREALELDPLYADAFAVLANTYQGFAWYGQMPADEAFAKAETAAKKAVALDSASALGHAMLAATLSFYHYRWAEGEEEFRRAIALDPEDGYVRNFYALHLRSLGRFPEALAQVRRAQEMDQLYRHYYWAAGYTLTLAGSDEDAIVELRRALQLDSTYWRAREELAGALARRGRYDAALREMGAGFTIAGDTEKANVVAATRGESGYRNAQRPLAEIDSQRLRVRARDGKYVSAFEQAMVLLDLGDREAAIAQLERACAVRDPRVTYVRFAPKYRAIANDPRVQALVRALNLP
jgi:DNA-binding SARP family transcriptional activator/Tfp pilus assembly protein PilF